MVDLSISLPESFLEEEVRCNHTIEKKTKEIWAIELDLLQQFINVCNKHNLKWFALGGTLLGAVRHGGFIPWDDDIDIIMPRKDYDILLKVGPEEFHFPYFFQCPLTENKFWRTHVQIRNSLTTGCIRADEKKNINRGVFIDIMVLDDVPELKEERSLHRKRIKRNRWLKYVERMRAGSNPVERAAGNGLASVLGNRFYRYSFRKINQICSQYGGTGTTKVGHTTLSYRECLVWDKEDYSESIPMDFEFMKINAPVGYQRILETQFGADYMKIPFFHPLNAHGGLVIDTDTPYTVYFKKQN